MKIVKLPTGYWHDNETLTLKVPRQWNIKVHHMNGYASPELSDRQIRRRLMNPVQSETIRNLAAKRKEAVILFDDLTRPTPAFRIIPHILTELAKGGISPQHVRFVCASAAHGMSNRADFARKLGERVVERFPVYNHNPFHNLQDLGVTTRGTPVQINSEVMACDLKIGVGGILPHSMAGFGGGGKIILPGVASIESICHNHCAIAGDCFERRAFTPFQPVEHNESRADINEAVRMARLDFKIDTIINESGKISGLFAGDPIEEWKEGVEVAKTFYSTDSPSNADVVVANTFLKENQAISAMGIAALTVRDGGTVVLIGNAPEGQNAHYLYGKFGRKLGGKLWSCPPPLPKKMRIIVYSRYKERDPQLEIADPEDLIWTKTWRETLEAISAPTKNNLGVAIFPTAGIQISQTTFQQPPAPTAISS